MQVDPIKPKLIPPGTKRLKMEYDGLLSKFAFTFNLCRYNKAEQRLVGVVGLAEQVNMAFKTTGTTEHQRQAAFSQENEGRARQM